MEGFASIVSSTSMDSNNIFSPEWVGVQNRGMKRWISIEFSKKFGICANFEYFFPREIIDRILLLSKTAAMDNMQPPSMQNNDVQTCSDGGKAGCTQIDTTAAALEFDRNVILWKSMAALPGLIHKKEFQGIQNYIKDDATGVRRYLFSKEIARIFDDYEIYRPEMILKWDHADQNNVSRTNASLENFIDQPSQDENMIPERIFQLYGIEDPKDLWQPVLWKRMMEQGTCSHLADTADFFFRQNVKEVFENRRLQFPERISFFGISSMPPLFLKILDRAARFIDINLFLLLPSKEFFGYISSEKQMGKIADKIKRSDSDFPGHFNTDNDYAGNDVTPGNTPFTSEDDFYLEQGNPLLASMGTSIKNFSLMLEDTSYNEPFSDLWYDPMSHSDSMLACLQSDILCLVHRKKGKDKAGAEISGGAVEKNTDPAEETASENLSEVIQSPEPLEISDQDRSISIHSCHGPMREAQVLKDQLLDLFLKDPDLKPHDIIVMMPDIESYAPYIESVFSVEHRIAFTISDRKKRVESEMVETFLEILAAGDSRLTLTEVLDILIRKPVSLKFNFSEEDIITIRKTAEKAGICWGMDALHRKHMGLPDFNENTWWFGFQRLMLGYGMPENTDSLFMGILPCDSFEGTEAEILGRFARFCDILFDHLKKLSNPRKIDEWCDTFRDIFFSMITADKDGKDDRKFILEALEKLRSAAKNACYEADISFEVAMAALHAELDRVESSGAFLTGGMVFCNLMPMRSIPFKVVALMGMNDQAFPRQDIAESFDLIRKYPLPGDRVQRDEGRYLFLEALLSARQNFIITYTGMSIKDNSVIPPAGVVSELVDTIYESFIFSDGNRGCDKDSFIVVHPLQAFSEKYFQKNGSPCLFSFSEHYLRIAENLKRGEKSGKDFCKKSNFISEALETIPLQDRTITLNDLISFFRMPGEYFIKKRLGIVFSEEPGFIDDREPVELDGLENYFIGQSIVEKEIHHKKKAMNERELHPTGKPLAEEIFVKENHDKKIKDLYPVFKASGRLPHGKKGKIEFDDIKANAEPVYTSAVDDIMPDEMSGSAYADIRIGDTRITGTVDNIRTGQGRYEYTFSRFSPKRLLKAWIYHLVLNSIAENKYPVETHIIVRSQKQGRAEKIYFPPMEDPFSPLSDLIDLFWKGMEYPLIFFPETSWTFAERIFKSNSGLSDESIKKAVSACMKKWHDPFRKTGEKSNRYISLIFKNRDLFDEPFHGMSHDSFNESSGESSGESGGSPVYSDFIATAMKVFSPVMEKMKRK